METKTTFNVNNVTKNNTPPKWGNVSSSIRYFFVGLIGLVTATDIISQTVSDITVLALSVLILLLKSIDMGLGLEVKE